MTQFTEMALKVAESKQSGASAAGDQTMRMLVPLITQTARRIHASKGMLRQQAAHDFATEAPSLVWKRIHKFRTWYFSHEEQVRRDPSKEWFLAWCYTELHYRYLDWRRHEGRECHLYLRGDEEIADKFRAASAPDSAADSSMPSEDLQLVLDCNALDGVIFCCLTGQWANVPAGTWNAWLADLSLAAPFPPPEFLRAEPSQRRARLISVLGISRDVLYQRWRRLKLKFQPATMAT